MRHLAGLVVCVLFWSGVSGCGSRTAPAEAGRANTAKPVIESAGSPEKTPDTRKSVSVVDVPGLGNKPARRFDEVFGAPVKITEIKDNPKFMPGEYREYRVAGHPKNLSVRFYKDRAKRFNLLLGTPEKSARAALKNIFKIETRGMRQIKSGQLSDTWKGKSGGLVYKTAYAKRGKARGDFVMLHAEVK